MCAPTWKLVVAVVSAWPTIEEKPASRPITVLATYRIGMLRQHVEHSVERYRPASDTPFTGWRSAM
ncbi:hypothetical protein GCM10007392_02610 [Saccharospirillum salsuginis]|uniref:Uncharacterized protein n=1 Tax=Saccharospirillum salsuginis TaxID=418750 RepID=A0A918JZT8_9GAMM|nr:hypothetical protein GCM10007392_02610 [Saccharospirillum salsuginis]